MFVDEQHPDAQRVFQLKTEAERPRFLDKVFTRMLCKGLSALHGAVAVVFYAVIAILIAAVFLFHLPLSFGIIGGFVVFCAGFGVYFDSIR